MIQFKSLLASRGVVKVTDDKGVILNVNVNMHVLFLALVMQIEMLDSPLEHRLFF